MTPEKLQQVEGAKEALPLAIDLPKTGYKEWRKACDIISFAGFALVERVIELEAEVQRLKEWQGKALPYLEATLAGCHVMRESEILDVDGEADIEILTALITEAQGGEEA